VVVREESGESGSLLLSPGQNCIATLPEDN
jgi:hypothetical protein